MVDTVQRVASGCSMKTGNGDDVAGTHMLHTLPVLRAHPTDSRQAQFLTSPGVQHRRPSRQTTGVDAQPGQGAVARLDMSLERERSEGSVLLNRPADRLVGAGREPRRNRAPASTASSKG